MGINPIERKKKPNKSSTSYVVLCNTLKKDGTSSSFLHLSSTLLLRSKILYLQNGDPNTGTKERIEQRGWTSSQPNSSKYTLTFDLTHNLDKIDTHTKILSFTIKSAVYRIECSIGTVAPDMSLSWS